MVPTMKPSASPEAVFAAPPSPGPDIQTGEGEIRRPIIDLLGEFVPLLVLVIIYFLAGKGLAWMLESPLQTRPIAVAISSGIGLSLVLLASVLVGSLTIWGLTRAAAWLPSRRGHPTRIADRASAFLRGAISPSRTLRLLLTFALLGVFMNTFVGFKRAIPKIQPFMWDVDFMRLDAFLHGGQHPWEILHPFLSHPGLTNVIDLLYYLWFPIHLIGLTAIVWGSTRAARTRFLMGFCLVWIVLGTALAILFSSAGPCYFGLVVADVTNPYVSLMAYLESVDRTHGLIALQIQHILWQGYVQGTTHVLIEGISAMPSLHIALPILYAQATWRIHRALGVGFLIFTIIMLIGSVHLAWHYAIDGYLSILLVPAVWWVSGRIVPFKATQSAATA